jgi:hypothetical protein
VYQSQSLPASPAGALIRAHDGDVNIQVTLGGPCPDLRVFDAAGGFQLGNFADIGVTMYVATNSGEYATTPVVIRMTTDPITCVPGSIMPAFPGQITPGQFQCRPGL